MRATLRDSLTAALKARDRVAVAALRSALSAIDNAEAVPLEHQRVTGDEHFAGASAGVGATEAQRRDLTEADVRAVVENEVRERTTAAAEYAQRGLADAAARLHAEAEVLSRHLDA
ncbi:GatB/YqeY domain-containing protein [Allokutzneria sp. NRRL B-24872]|uniref:GatB/YqeY domain-containing protein n=1 Tax=Allokutzneria sp. NRRL B-24872 TaxID=1137961 RepID=UPI000A3B376C|nr:GatB/YqeY domain-containing protein [Allokutzneria sp. NRRL B-24872]